MAWNPPGKGSSGDDERRPVRSRGRGPGGFGPVFDRARDLFGGGNPLRWVALLVGLWLLFNCFVLVYEQERGVVLRFGQFARVLQPGPHFKLPWPIERVTKINAEEIKTFNDNLPVLTRDENIVQVEINVQYRITDPRLFLFGTRNAAEVLEQAALSTVREQVGRSTLDTVLGAREALATTAQANLQRSLDAYRTGLVVTELSLPNARPPEEVKPAFDDVNSAQQDKDRLISEAQAYAAKVVPEARGEAARTRTVADGYKTAAIARATGDAQRFSLLVEQYRDAPEVTRKRLWLETVQDVLADNRVIVGGDSRQILYVPTPEQRARRPAVSTEPPPELVTPMVGAEADARTGGDRPPRPDGREESTR